MKIRAAGFRVRSSYHSAFSNDGDHLIVVGRDLVLWNVRRRERLRSTRVLRHPSSAAFAPDGATFVAKNTLGELILFDVATLQPLSRFVPPGRDEGAEPIYASDDRIIDASWAGEIRARDVRDLLPRVVWRGEDQMVTGVMRASHLWAFVVKGRHSHPEFGTDAGADLILLGVAPIDEPLQPLPRRWRFLGDSAISCAGDRIAVRHGAPPSMSRRLFLSRGIRSARDRLVAK